MGIYSRPLNILIWFWFEELTFHESIQAFRQQCEILKQLLGFEHFWWLPDLYFLYTISHTNGFTHASMNSLDIFSFRVWLSFSKRLIWIVFLGRRKHIDDNAANQIIDQMTRRGGANWLGSITWFILGIRYRVQVIDLKHCCTNCLNNNRITYQGHFTSALNDQYMVKDI